MGGGSTYILCRLYSTLSRSSEIGCDLSLEGFSNWILKEEKAWCVVMSAGVCCDECWCVVMSADMYSPARKMSC